MGEEVKLEGGYLKWTWYKNGRLRKKIMYRVQKYLNLKRRNTLKGNRRVREEKNYDRDFLRRGMGWVKETFGSLLLGEESFQGNFILCGFEVRECGHKDKNKEYKV